MVKSVSIYKSFFLLAAIFLFAGFGLKACNRAPAAATKPVELVWWRVFDNESDFDTTLQAWRAVHPNISIRYRKLRFEEYESELLNALAEDRGPDIVALSNTWLGKYQSKLLPMPASVTLPFITTQGTIKKEQVTVLKTLPMPSVRTLKTQYVDVVGRDVLWKVPTSGASDAPREDRIFGLPLSVDTMALFSNVDLLNRAGVPEPPRTWSAFQEAVKRITKIDDRGNILQSGAAIGTSGNIQRSVDLLSLLMMQNGTVMDDESGYVLFDRVPPELSGKQLPPGEEAVRFYTDFANPTKEVYTWNTGMPNSLEAFLQGRTAFFFGYSYHLPDIRARAPKLNLRIAPMPQIEGNPEVNYANYWVDAVSKKSTRPNEAWAFLQFLHEEQNVKAYLEKTKKPTALRSLITTQQNDLELGTFAAQILTAKSWYRGKDVAAMETIMKQLIDTVLDARREPRDALNLAAQQVNQTIR